MQLFNLIAGYDIYTVNGETLLISKCFSFIWQKGFSTKIKLNIKLSIIILVHNKYLPEIKS